jgi:intracellular multiplication protein IcmC
MIIDITQMFSNLARSLIYVQYMVIGLSYVLGVGFIVHAGFALKLMIERGGERASGINISTPMGGLLGGVALLYLPSTLTAFSITVFGYNTSILAYQQYNPYDLMGSMSILMNTIGLFWCVRGLTLLAESGRNDNSGGRGGLMKSKGPKGIAFLLAGICAINFLQILPVIYSGMQMFFNSQFL